MSESQSGLIRHEWEVRPAPFQEARSAVSLWHYSRSTSNTATYCHGLYRTGDREIMGAALWMPPIKTAALSVSDQWRSVLCLTRLAVHPDAPRNAASFLLGGSMRLIDRKRWPRLLTYADTGRGHTGAIYRATNWICLGEVRAGDVWVHSTTGEQRGRKRGPRTWTVAEMLAAGFVRQPQLPKIKFVHENPHRSLPVTDGRPR
jgi:hypothetical protein